MDHSLVDNDFHRNNAVFELFTDLEVKDLNVELPGKPETNGSTEQNGAATKN
jgi:methylenetetrahydrofolate reductase (NADPH)